MKYTETQSLRPIGFYLASSLFVLVIIFEISIASKYDFILGLGIAFNLFFIYFSYLIFIKAKLITTIDSVRVSAYWTVFKYSFFKKEYFWTDIRSCEIITYSFVGYGYRLSFKYGLVLNSRGNKGLLVKSKNGDKFLLGTQKVKELKQYISNLNKQILVKSDI